MKIAVAGCAHGELEIIYDTIQYLESENNIKVDLLLCCGDFQATRNLDDLQCMAVPPKYRDICTFYKYYSGEKLAPILTIFIGGNHEASNYLQELPFGGWVAPNVYYLGYAGVVNYGGIRIAGLSGIFKAFDYYKGRFEKPPYNGESMRSCYHIRNLDVFRLKQLSQPVQIMLSHDWPSGVYHHGDVKKLLRDKSYFRDEIQNDSLGNKPTAELLDHMKPDYWFAAHLHVKFPAVVEHKGDDVQKITKFLALDKCLPRRKFLQVVDVPHDSNEDFELKYDLEWLTILHLTNSLVSVKKVNSYMPSPQSSERWSFTPKPEDMDFVMKKFHNNLTIPHNFVATAPSYNPNAPQRSEERLTPKINPQTVEFCEKLGIDDPMSLLLSEDGFNNSNSSFHTTSFDSSSFLTPTDSEFEMSHSSVQGISPVVKGRGMFKTPLKLPKPLNSSDISGDECLTSTPYKCESSKSGNDADSSLAGVAGEEGKDDSVRGEGSDAAGGDSSDLSGAPGPKKFRRRNLAMYASNDEDA